MIWRGALFGPFDGGGPRWTLWNSGREGGRVLFLVAVRWSVVGVGALSLENRTARGVERNFASGPESRYGKREFIVCDLGADGVHDETGQASSRSASKIHTSSPCAAYWKPRPVADVEALYQDVEGACRFDSWIPVGYRAGKQTCAFAHLLD
jgi:hypothetical protein